jgi:hypothetical protein
MRPVPRPSTALLAPALLLLAACGAGEAAAPDPTGPDVQPTVPGVGALPSTPLGQDVEVVEDVEEQPAVEPVVVITRPVDELTGEELATVGEQVAGNRLIMLGDSILAATSSRYGGEMCDGLVPLGWQVEVDAEPGRFIDFGGRVLQQRLDPFNWLDWDAAVVFLGSNYRGDQAAYEAELVEILDTLGPRPTLLYTVTVYRPDWAEVNEVVRRQAEARDNVTLVDWEAVARTPGVLSSDRLHPSRAGEQVLVDLTADALGPAPELTDADGQAVVGECLPTSFTDDSAIGAGSIGASDRIAVESGSSSSVGSWNPGSSGSGDWSSDGSGGVVTTTAPQTTSAPDSTEAPLPPPTEAPATTAAPPPTAPPPTAPPPTAPPPTAPPATAPPATDPPSGADG